MISEFDSRQVHLMFSEIKFILTKTFAFLIDDELSKEICYGSLRIFNEATENFPQHVLSFDKTDKYDI
jgi:hypothetical protein